MIEHHDFEYLAAQLETGRVLLFTGAGFSTNARDRAGRPLPLGHQAADELWQICFPGTKRDTESSLQDLYEIALSKHRAALTSFLTTRFAVEPSSLGGFYELWFRAPWWRVYTLNVDDLESAVARRFNLPRQISSVSAVAVGHRATVPSPGRPTLEVVHLNGLAQGGPDEVTFSTLQYARRIGGSEQFYPQLVAELASHPCVFVGSPLDESPLWQHIELRGSKGSRENRELRRKSFLVSPSLSVARRELLRDFNIVWISATAEEFASHVLSKLERQFSVGHMALGSSARSGPPVGPPIQLVQDLTGSLRDERTYYLVGDEPRWSDIAFGRAVFRESDATVLSHVLQAVGSSSSPRPAVGSLLLLTGTAGTGKSTALMRLGLRLTADGERVGWSGASSEASPRDLERFPDDFPNARILLVDSAERYGGELASVVRSLLGEGRLSLLALGVRASRVERLLEGPRLQGIPTREISIPLLADQDINGLLDLLTKNNLLGQLTGRTREEQVHAFQEVADRQLLVAMLEATSGRRFEEKIFAEWEELSRFEKEAYGLVALAYSHGHRLDRDDVLVASGEAGNSTLNAIEALVRRGLLRDDEFGLLRTRHRLVGEKLIDELLVRHKGLVLGLHSRVTFAAAARARPSDRRNQRQWRLLKVLLNHELLYRLFDYQGASSVYDEVESVLAWDFHYHLQRGCLELEYGDLRLAESLLGAARSLAENDPKVATAFAHMLFKKACANPDSQDSKDLVAQAVEILQEQIQERGDRDPYPFHVLGSQGLAWMRRSRTSESTRLSFQSLLIKNLAEGLAKHPTNADLRQLLDDLRREDLLRVVREERAGGGSRGL